MAERQPDERAARRRVPERRALAGEVRQEDDAVGAGRRRAGLLDQAPPSSTPPPRTSLRNQSSARPVAAIAPPTRVQARAAARSSRTSRARPAAGPSRRRTRRPRRRGPSRRPARGHAARRGSSPRRRRCPATTGMPARARGASAASGGQLADDRAGANRRRDLRGGHARPMRARPRPGTAGPRRGSSPPGRSAAARATSHVARYQRVAAATAGSLPLEPERGRQPGERPALEARRRGELRLPRRSTRVSCQMIAGRVGAARRRRPRRASGRGRRSPIATTSPTSSRGRARGPPGAIAPHHASGSCSARPVAGSASVRVARPGEAEQPAVERDEAGLDLGRAEVDREDRRLARVIATPVRARGPRRPARATASAVGDVGHERRQHPAAQRAEDRPDLRRRRRRRRSGPGSRSRSRASNAIVRSRERRRRRTGRRGRTARRAPRRPRRPARARRRRRGAERRRAPGRPADPEGRDLEAVPEVERSGARRRGRRASASSPGRRRGPGARSPMRQRRRSPSATRRNGSRAGPREPVAAAQRDDGRAGLVERLVGGERIGHRRDRRPVADADDRAVADRAAQHLRRRAGRSSAG